MGKAVKRNIPHQIENKCPWKNLILSSLASVLPNVKGEKTQTKEDNIVRTKEGRAVKRELWIALDHLKEPQGGLGSQDEGSCHRK